MFSCRFPLAGSCRSRWAGCWQECFGCLPSMGNSTSSPDAASNAGHWCQPVSRCKVLNLAFVWSCIHTTQISFIRAQIATNALRCVYSRMKFWTSLLFQHKEGRWPNVLSEKGFFQFLSPFKTGLSQSRSTNGRYARMSNVSASRVDDWKDKRGLNGSKIQRKFSFMCVPMPNTRKTCHVKAVWSVFLWKRVWRNCATDGKLERLFRCPSCHWCSIRIRHWTTWPICDANSSTKLVASSCHVQAGFHNSCRSSKPKTPSSWNNALSTRRLPWKARDSMQLAGWSPLPTCHFTDKISLVGSVRSSRPDHRLDLAWSNHPTWRSDGK